MAEPKPPTVTRNSYRQYLGKLEPHDAHAPRFDSENISEFLDKAETYKQYKDELRELYAGQDEFRQRGTRAFIESYVKEV
ncbi:hypothetical protein PTT_14608 [Pyrenophora teres f. teres 0-1]|uniref:Uncharacterized protein n=1 Tax=Pyrenophora teres f. teres (strain 0-1) TaxID=861557 RepID=E3RYI6_PYRTT|nr:hypothetical protein PTT_14608 [Pyrenophora teres f. teres 0-1]